MLQKKLTAAASFGTAISSIYLAPELQADIVDLTFNGGNPQAVATFSTVPFNPATAAKLQDIDQFAGSFDMVLFNNIGFTPAGIRALTTVSGNMQVGLATGLELKGSTFTGGSMIGGSGTLAGTGTKYVGFRETATGNVGYFKVDFVAGGDLTVTGRIGSMGENVQVPGAIPEPSALAGLALLALGAAGQRKRVTV